MQIGKHRNSKVVVNSLSFKNKHKRVILEVRSTLDGSSFNAAATAAVPKHVVINATPMRTFVTLNKNLQPSFYGKCIIVCKCNQGSEIWNKPK